MTADLSPLAYHFLDAGAPEALRSFIAANAGSAWDALDGMSGGALVSLNACFVWRRILEGEGHASMTLSGWYRAGSDNRGHVFMAVGPSLHLFDPTAAQFVDGRSASVSAENYLIRLREWSHDSTPFLDWRAQQLASQG
ncbi:MAG: hypothetical protein Q7K37_06810 [Dehalococcoidia bacterium]|nr:hypothetical protein [Dehalococcoidia bacterium]